MRRPSSRAEKYALYRALLRGDGRVTEDEPAPGFYWRRYVRGGPRVPVEIRMIQEVCPDTGELTADEYLIAIIGTSELKEVISKHCAVCDIWIRCAKNAISRDEYFALLETAPASWSTVFNPLEEILR